MDAREGAGPLAGRVAVVTGATRGIGRETALALATRGASVVIVGRSHHARPHRLLPGTIEEVGAMLRTRTTNVVEVVADVSSEEGVREIADRTIGRFGRFDILVNNAAYSTDFGPAVSTPLSRWQTSWKVNVLGPLMLCQAFVPGMIERGTGRVINISSGASATNVPGQLPYGATKAALERITVGYGADHGPAGVGFDVVRIDEGIPTEAYLLVSGSIGVTTRGTPLSTPHELGEAIAWLAAEETPVTTGRILGLGDLRELGALPEPTFVLPSAPGG